jgi:hypothetical protein
MKMKTKVFLSAVVLVGLLASLFAFTTTTKSAASHIPAGISRLSVQTEPNVRMWSGAIQFSDSNYADFRPHVQPSAKQTVSKECMIDEQVVPRKQSGCIQ